MDEAVMTRASRFERVRRGDLSGADVLPERGGARSVSPAPEPFAATAELLGELRAIRRVLETPATPKRSMLWEGDSDLAASSSIIGATERIPSDYCIKSVYIWVEDAATTFLFRIAMSDNGNSGVFDGVSIWTGLGGDGRVRVGPGIYHFTPNVLGTKATPYIKIRATNQDSGDSHLWHCMMVVELEDEK